jgi:hypothetical protein
VRPERRAPRAALALLLATCGCFAQAQEPWQEAPTAAPPALKLDRLVSVDVTGSELRFGVQPDSVTIDPDGVVRYVVAATSASGVVSAFHEGLRCVSGEVKVYARHHPDTGWTPVKDPTWRPLQGNAAQRHSLAIARNGACIGRGSNRSAAQIVRDLAAPAETRFRNEVR